MSVFVYDITGIIDTRGDSEWKQVGLEVASHNEANPTSQRKIFVGPAFPPPGHVYDTGTGELRAKTLQESVTDGDIALPPDHVIQTGPKGQRMVSPLHKLDTNGDVVDKTMQEKVNDGVVTMDTQTQKIENEQIVPKTNQELLDDGVITLADMKQQTIDRLRGEVERHFATTKTTNGYSLDMLARQKASFSHPYRNIADTDPDKAQLLADKVIYPNAIVDEILAAVKVVQTAYSDAVAAANSAESGSQPASVFEAIKLANYLV